jgi:hypothetical protein
MASDMASAENTLRQKACSDYLAEHHIETLLDNALSALLNDLPEDPKRFIVTFMEGLMPARDLSDPIFQSEAMADIEPLAEDATEADRLRSFRFLASSMLATTRGLQDKVGDLERTRLQLKRKITALRRDRQVCFVVVLCFGGFGVSSCVLLWLRVCTNIALLFTNVHIFTGIPRRKRETQP